MEGHAGDQRLDFLTGYWTLYVLMSWTVFSKILELVNMLQSSKSTCKSRRRDHTDTEYQRGNHWRHQALQPPSPVSRVPLPPTAFHTHQGDSWAWRLSLRACSASPPPPPAGLTSSSWRGHLCSGPIRVSSVPCPSRHGLFLLPSSSLHLSAPRCLNTENLFHT